MEWIEHLENRLAAEKRKTSLLEAERDAALVRIAALEKELEEARETSECRCATAEAVSLDLEECRREVDKARERIAKLEAGLRM